MKKGVTVGDLTFPGWSDLVGWFGRVPGFHDAEVLSVHLRRHPEPSLIRIRAWNMTEQSDERGYYVRERDAVVRFILGRITLLELGEWNHQNVLFGLSIAENESGYELSFDGTYGMTGRIVADDLRIELEPTGPDSAANGQSQR